MCILIHFAVLRRLPRHLQLLPIFARNDLRMQEGRPWVIGDVPSSCRSARHVDKRRSNRDLGYAPGESVVWFPTTTHQGLGHLSGASIVEGVKEAHRNVIREQKSVKSLQVWNQRIPAISGEKLKPFGAQRNPHHQRHLDGRNLIVRRLG